MRWLGPGTSLTTNTEWYWNDDNDELVQRTYQDVEPIIKANKAAQNDWGGRFGNKETFHHVATIPHAEIVKWMNEKGINAFNQGDFEDAVIKMLNDPDWKNLKTKNVRI